MSGFWKAWIQVWCWAVIGFGVFFASAAFPATDAGVRLFYDAIFWPVDGMASFGDPQFRLTVALIGCVTIGWGVLFLGGVSLALRGESRLWGWLTASIGVWFVTDSILSVVLGAPVNVISNTGLLVGYLIPVLATGVLKRA